MVERARQTRRNKNPWLTKFFHFPSARKKTTEILTRRIEIFSFALSCALIYKFLFRFPLISEFAFCFVFLWAFACYFTVSEKLASFAVFSWTVVYFQHTFFFASYFSPLAFCLNHSFIIWLCIFEVLLFSLERERRKLLFMCFLVALFSVRRWVSFRNFFLEYYIEASIWFISNFVFPLTWDF